MCQRKKAASEGKSSERGEEATVTVVETKQDFVLSSRDTTRLPTDIETFIHVLFLSDKLRSMAGGHLISSIDCVLYIDAQCHHDSRVPLSLWPPHETLAAAVFSYVHGRKRPPDALTPFRRCLLGYSVGCIPGALTWRRWNALGKSISSTDKLSFILFGQRRLQVLCFKGFHLR